jgi:hypothetical protein
MAYFMVCSIENVYFVAAHASDATVVRPSLFFFFRVTLAFQRIDSLQPTLQAMAHMAKRAKLACVSMELTESGDVVDLEACRSKAAVIELPHGTLLSTVRCRASEELLPCNKELLL